MPGLKQLQSFSKDVENLGNEIQIRKQRGEKPVSVPLPKGISEEDDSQDFVLGLPSATSDEAPDVSTKAAPPLSDFVDIDLEELDSAGTSEELSQAPNFDDLFTASPAADDDLPDLSDFETDVLPPPTEEKEETPLEDMDLEALLGTPSDEPEEVADLEAEAIPEAAEEPESIGSKEPAADDSSLGLGDIPDIPDDATDLSDLAGMGGLPQFDDIQGTAATENGLDEIPDMQSMLNAIADDEPAAESEAATAAESDSADTVEAANEPAVTPETETTFADIPATDMTAATEPAADENATADTSIPADDQNAAGATEPAVTDPLAAGIMQEEPQPSADGDFPADTPVETEDALSPDSFDLDGLGSLDTSLFSGNGDIGTVDLPSVDDLVRGLDAETESSAAGDTAAAAESDAFSTTGIERPDAALTPENNGIDFDLASLEVPNPGNDMSIGADEAPIETFDTSDIDGLNFSDESADGEKKDIFASLAEDFPVTGEGNSDFELSTDFEIPGFSDTDVAPITPKKVDSPDFSKADSAKPRNSLTEEEFEQFKKNLAAYPLNLRIIVEDLIAKDEYTEDAVFEVIEKVLKKTSARSLAGHLEKLLDITINIPRDFERRSVAEYEAYKQSFQYQLKNRILPGAIAAVLLLLVGYGLFRAGHHFIYKPAKAASLYKQGYTLLENNEYPQSEELFKRAESYRAVKKWFFTYARGYRNHKQYERAANMYKHALRIFRQDKLAGLEYAEMELYDRANYPRAEEIIRREVLDYHVNDADGILLLGDTFLEWADSDSSKFEDARAQYATLIQLYGGNNLYLARMMLYFIRTDRLRNVLELKNHFYSTKKPDLTASDWTELSGYLLDKLYGPLSKSDEYLRTSIEDVLDMLQTAVRMAPESPTAHYNLARYHIENSNFDVAQRQLELSLDLFDKAPVRTRRTVYKEIDAARQLGELYATDKKYIKAQTAYTRGITVFKDENKRAGLEGDANTGKLFADMADIDYFISGDLESALYNYKQAVMYKQNTPSVIYRIGAIQYTQEDYTSALNAFITAAESDPSDPNLLLALANTLSLKGDNFAAQGYYEDLISRLDLERARRNRLEPQKDKDDNKIVDLYVKASNNLGVTLYRLARQTGNSKMNAEAAVRLSDSMRAWDALTRNPATMLRLGGSNLASQNSKYMMHPFPDFEPAIYTKIAKALYTDQELE